MLKLSSNLPQFFRKMSLEESHAFSTKEIARTEKLSTLASLDVPHDTFACRSEYLDQRSFDFDSSEETLFEDGSRFKFFEGKK
jgi:hypothetical protein